MPFVFPDDYTLSNATGNNPEVLSGILKQGIIDKISCIVAQNPYTPS